jgi:hypothetical protein
VPSLNASLVLVVLVVLAALIGQPGCRPEPTTPEASVASPTSQPTSAPTTQPSRPIVGLQPGWELAPRGEYSAARKAGAVTIRATGESPTAGYEVKLVQSPLRIWPPQWMLARKPPDGIVAQVITPFDVAATFNADEPVRRVVVSDGAGKHTLEVAQERE